MEPFRVPELRLPSQWWDGQGLDAGQLPREINLALHYRAHDIVDDRRVSAFVRDLTEYDLTAQDLSSVLALVAELSSDDAKLEGLLDLAPTLRDDQDLTLRYREIADTITANDLRQRALDALEDESNGAMPAPQAEYAHPYLDFRELENPYLDVRESESVDVGTTGEQPQRFRFTIPSASATVIHPDLEYTTPYLDLREPPEMDERFKQAMEAALKRARERGLPDRPNRDMQRLRRLAEVAQTYLATVERFHDETSPAVVSEVRQQLGREVNAQRTLFNIWLRRQLMESGDHELQQLARDLEQLYGRLED